LFLVLSALHLLSLLVFTASSTSDLAATSDEIFRSTNLLLTAQDSVLHDATTTEIQLAKDTLLQFLFSSDTEGISKKHKLTAKAGENLSVYSTGDMDPTIVALDNKVKTWL
jgi:hypothetical protein